MAENLVPESLLKAIENEKMFVQKQKEENQREMAEILAQYNIFNTEYNTKMEELEMREQLAIKKEKENVEKETSLKKWELSLVDKVATMFNQLVMNIQITLSKPVTILVYKFYSQFNATCDLQEKIDEEQRLLDYEKGAFVYEVKKWMKMAKESITFFQPESTE